MSDSSKRRTPVSGQLRRSLGRDKAKNTSGAGTQATTIIASVVISVLLIVGAFVGMFVLGGGNNEEAPPEVTDVAQATIEALGSRLEAVEVTLVALRPTATPTLTNTPIPTSTPTATMTHTPTETFVPSSTPEGETGAETADTEEDNGEQGESIEEAPVAEASEETVNVEDPNQDTEVVTDASENDTFIWNVPAGSCDVGCTVRAEASTVSSVMESANPEDRVVISGYVQGDVVNGITEWFFVTISNPEIDEDVVGYLSAGILSAGLRQEILEVVPKITNPDQPE